MQTTYRIRNNGIEYVTDDTDLIEWCSEQGARVTAVSER